MEGETEQVGSPPDLASQRGRRKRLATVALCGALVAWPLGGLDWRNWEHLYRDWRVRQKVHTGMSLEEVLAVMPEPTQTAGHAGTQYLEFDGGAVQVTLDYGERVVQVAVQPSSKPGTPPWLITLALVALAAYTARLWWRDRKPPPGHCPHCAYDLRGNTSGRCPECGQVIAESTAEKVNVERREDSPPSPQSEEQRSERS